MRKKFKKSKLEKAMQFFLRFARKIEIFNNTENEALTEEFNEEEGYLTTEKGATPRAKAMLLADLANGVLDELYRFK